MENIDYKRLALELLEQGKTEKATGTAPTAQMGHGSGGLFSNAGLETDLFSAFVLPNYGLYSILPQYPTQTENPLFGIVTGVTDSTGSEPTGPCDNPPYAGLMKLCMQTYPLGRFSRQTRTAELDAFGKLNNRADHKDLRINGNGGNGIALPGAPSFASSGNPANNDIDKILFEFVVSFTRDFAPMIWNGSTANNTWQGGYKEFIGLDTLINTGYRDAVSSTVCAAADPVVKSFGDVQIQNNTAGIVNDITQIYYELMDRSRRMGLDPATWVICMAPSLFHVLTSYWACSYLTYRCFNADNASVIDPQGTYSMDAAIALRDGMRTGSYLWIDGVKVTVIQDDTITQTNVGSGVSEGKIYFVPMTVLGGRPVTYMEYFDYSVAGGFMDAANALAPQGFYKVTDGGRFAVHLKPPANWCVEIVAKTEPRVLLRTPQISAVLTDVRWIPYVHERDWDPDGTYFVNGGSISQAKTTYYSVNAR